MSQSSAHRLTDAEVAELDRQFEEWMRAMRTVVTVVAEFCDGEEFVEVMTAAEVDEWLQTVDNDEIVHLAMRPH
jgi:hypothetical protein